jgi:hypothetical protein
MDATNVRNYATTPVDVWTSPVRRQEERVSAINMNALQKIPDSEIYYYRINNPEKTVNEMEAQAYHFVPEMVKTMCGYLVGFEDHTSCGSAAEPSQSMEPFGVRVLLKNAQFDRTMVRLFEIDEIQSAKTNLYPKAMVQYPLRGGHELYFEMTMTREYDNESGLFIYNVYTGNMQVTANRTTWMATWNEAWTEFLALQASKSTEDKTNVDDGRIALENVKEFFSGPSGDRPPETGKTSSGQALQDTEYEMIGKASFAEPVRTDPAGTFRDMDVILAEYRLVEYASKKEVLKKEMQEAYITKAERLRMEHEARQLHLEKKLAAYQRKLECIHENIETAHQTMSALAERKAKILDEYLKIQKAIRLNAELYDQSVL